MISRPRRTWSRVHAVWGRAGVGCRGVSLKGEDMTVFLDFDGVLCDSVLECFVSSWIAWYREIRGEEPAAVPLEHRELFYCYRPFMRTGEDFVLLQDLISRGVTLSSQQGFDTLLGQVGVETMLRYRQQIYAVRERLLRDDHEAWLRLNRVFPHVQELLPLMADRENFFILSTKKQRFIQEILAGTGTQWPSERAICSEQRPKVTIIQEVMARRGDSVAHFVEDQPNHFPTPETRSSLPFTLNCYLAAWGYVQQQWLTQSAASGAAYDVMDAAAFKELVSAWMVDSQA